MIARLPDASRCRLMPWAAYSRMRSFAARRIDRVVPAAQAAVGAKYEQDGVLDLGVRGQQRVLDLAGVGAQVGGQLGDLAGVRLRLHGPVEGLAELGGGDQLHRPRDLADVADRLAAFHEFAGIRHSINPN